MIDLALSDEQQALVESFASLLARSSAPEQVREAEAEEPTGFDPKLWQALVDTGAVTMGVPEAAGGWGASLLDLALVAEQVGRAAAPAPVIEAQVAARLLARLVAGGCADAAGALEAAIAGTEIVTLAVRPPRAGTAGLVPAGAVCDAAVVPDGDRLLLVRPGDARRPVANLASAPLADLPVGDTDAVELAAGAGASEAFEAAIDEWLVLTAAAIVGGATAAHLIGCAYAAERVAFGRPIGAFQGIAHPLADDATALDGARLLVHKAAWELDRGGPRGRELAAMAFAFASTATERATYDALHVHGGYGFMLEYDVQLHYRRVRGWARVWGDADAATRRAADTRYAAAGETGEAG